MTEPVRGGVTETPQEVRVPDDLGLSERERTWLRHQGQQRAGQTSKYIRHQGARERARRLKQQGSA